MSACGKFARLMLLVFLIGYGCIANAFAEDEVEGTDDELAQQIQNPVANLVSLPFQNNTGFEAGPENDQTNILNIQPVTPVTVGNWNIINRTIFPLIYVPGFTSGLPELPEGDESRSLDSEFGLGDINFTPFVSPRDAGAVTWGIGPSINIDSASDSRIGSGKWSLGPSVVVLAQPGSWTVGALARQLWSFAGSDNRDDVDQFVFQPFLAYGLGGGWTINSSPLMVANWDVDSSNRWTVPIGGGIQKLVRLGPLPLNISVQGYANVERPRFAPKSELRVQFTFILPKFYQ